MKTVCSEPCAFLFLKGSVMVSSYQRNFFHLFAVSTKQLEPTYEVSGRAAETSGNFACGGFCSAYQQTDGRKKKKKKKKTG